ncbi:MAG: DUF5004 domain-containing protein [Bacteroidia bacterium]
MKRFFPNKLVVTMVSILFLTSSCKVEQSTIVGVWKPVTLILPESIKKTKAESDYIFMTFNQSKDILYHFHADSTFTLESQKDAVGFQDAKGKYSMTGNAIAISIYNTVLKSNIVKLTEREMHVQSTDSVTIIYERLKGQ